MTLWFVLALMTAAAIFAVLWPLGRARAGRMAGGDVAVYRDQLAEIAQDREAGLIGEREAEAARIEVSRRLLAAADAAEAAPLPATPLRRRRATALVALVLLPVAAVLLYLTLGAPHYAGEIFAARSTTPPADASIESMVAQIEAHLERNPQDGRGWEVLAPVYMRLGRFEDAVRARASSIRHLGASAARESDFGEAQVAAAGGVVTADAKAAFERALALDAGDIKGRFFIGLAAEQDGKPSEALRAWRDLLARAPADAPYRPLIEQSIARLAPAPAPALAGPSAEDMAAAANLPPERRNEMVRAMVARLDERLRQESGDVDGWLRLLRAYMVLGDRARAQDALARARAALSDDAEKRQRLDAAAKAMGIEG
ncbi:MAG: c-type cytochrome biogenesis protein CcmI [Pseudorhodoplanes sp.]